MTERSRLAAQVEGLGRAKVLCLGDVMLDRYIYGDVERISPEAPIPVFQITRQTAMPARTRWREKFFRSSALTSSVR